MTDQSKVLHFLLGCLFACMFAWPMIGYGVFYIRHPWVTKGEMLVHWPEALTFKRVDYSKMRPRD